MHHPARRRAFPLCRLLLALPLGLLLAGCDPDTHEILVGPRLPTAEEYTGGSWTTKPVLTCGRDVNAIAAWSEDDVLLVGDEGLALRVQGGEARNIDLPDGHDLLTVAAQPGGVAFAATGDGTICRLQNGAWTLELRSPLARRMRAMWSDPAGVVTAVGYGGFGFRRVGGAWQEFDTGAGEDLTALWGRGTDELWAVGAKGAVARFDGASWSVERPFGAIRQMLGISGDTSGQIAVCVYDSLGHFSTGLREGGIWRALPDFSQWGSRGAAFVGGQLTGWTSSRLFLWNGESWTAGGGLSESGRYFVQIDEALLLFEWSGLLVRLNEGGAQTVLPALDSVVDLEASPDGAIALTRNGWILHETDAGWRTVVQLPYYAQGGAGRSLVRLPSGELMALAGHLYRERDGAWEAMAGTVGFRAVFPLRDETLLLGANGELWRLTSDLSVFVCAPPGELGSLLAVAGRTLSDARFLFSGGLARYDGVTLAPPARGWALSLKGIQADPNEGLVLFGMSGLFACRDTTVIDLTPTWIADQERTRAQIVDFAITPAGDWLAWSLPGNLLRRAAGTWRVIGRGDAPLPWGGYSSYRGPWIRAGDDGDVLLFTDSHLFRYRDPAR